MYGHENLVFLPPPAEQPPPAVDFSGLVRASAVLNWLPWARICIRRLASRLNPFPQMSQKWMCSARSSTASISTISKSPSSSSFSESTATTSTSGLGLTGAGSRKPVCTADCGSTGDGSDRTVWDWEKVRRAALFTMTSWMAETNSEVTRSIWC
uniref:Uncharacterized protein n=1 Tax=Opuntia streptacantha TaxID=393608 RepID=A0A7C9CL04_OPUST